MALYNNDTVKADSISLVHSAFFVCLAADGLQCCRMLSAGLTHDCFTSHLRDTSKMSGILCWVSPDGILCWYIHNAIATALWVKAFVSDSEVRVQTLIQYHKIETQTALQVGYTTMPLQGCLNFCWEHLNYCNLSKASVLNYMGNESVLNRLNIHSN